MFGVFDGIYSFTTSFTTSYDTTTTTSATTSATTSYTTSYTTYYSTSYTTTSPYYLYTGGSPWYWLLYSAYSQWFNAGYWNGTTVFANVYGANLSSYSTGGYTYLKGQWNGSGNPTSGYYYSIARRNTTSRTTSRATSHVTSYTTSFTTTASTTVTTSNTTSKVTDFYA